MRMRVKYVGGEFAPYPSVSLTLSSATFSPTSCSSAFQLSLIEIKTLSPSDHLNGMDRKRERGRDRLPKYATH